MPRRHARMRLPPEQGKGLVDSGPIIPLLTGLFRFSPLYRMLGICT